MKLVGELVQSTRGWHGDPDAVSQKSFTISQNRPMKLLGHSQSKMENWSNAIVVCVALSVLLKHVPELLQAQMLMTGTNDDEAFLESVTVNVMLN